MGPQGFHLRVKPCLLAEVARTTQDPICFLDSDMLILQDLAAMEADLEAGDVYLQEREYRVSDRASKERREYMDRLAGVYLGDGVVLDEAAGCGIPG